MKMEDRNIVHLRKKVLKIRGHSGACCYCRGVNETHSGHFGYLSCILDLV